MYRAILLVTALITASGAYAQYGSERGPAFGGEGDVNFAKSLWRALTKARLVGARAIGSTPYAGTRPHGSVLQTLDTTVRVSGQQGEVIVKKNYDGPGVTEARVADDPAKYLKAITVMFRREPGYDEDNSNWFWVKYGPDGQVLRNPAGKALAGRVAKGAKNKGCIACHAAAPGGDYVFNHDRFAR